MNKFLLSSACKSQKLPAQEPPSAETCLPAPDEPLWVTRSVLWRPRHNVDAPQTTIFVTIGYAPGCHDFIPLEIRYNSGYPVDSDPAALVEDICIILTVFLQFFNDDHGIDTFAASLSRTMDLRHLSQESRVMNSCTQIRGDLLRLLILELQRPPDWATDFEADPLILSHPDNIVGDD